MFVTNAERLQINKLSIQINKLEKEQVNSMKT